MSDVFCRFSPLYDDSRHEKFIPEAVVSVMNDGDGDGVVMVSSNTLGGASTPKLLDPHKAVCISLMSLQSIASRDSTIG